MRRILDEADIDIAGIAMTVIIFLICALLLISGVAAKSEEVSQESPRVSHVVALNLAYDVKVLKTLGSKELLVEKYGKVLKCVTPTKVAFEHHDPLYCSDSVTINHK